MKKFKWKNLLIEVAKLLLAFLAGDQIGTGL